QRYTLSLHDALPILKSKEFKRRRLQRHETAWSRNLSPGFGHPSLAGRSWQSRSLTAFQPSCIIATGCCRKSNSDGHCQVFQTLGASLEKCRGASKFLDLATLFEHLTTSCSGGPFETRTRSEEPRLN